MVDQDALRMDEAERDAFLGTGGTGVLSIAGDAGDPPHSLPVAYGYDAVESDFYFRLSVGTEFDRSDVTGSPVTFVSYGNVDDEWKSVITTGRLEDVEESSIALDSLSGLERVTIPLIDMFGVPPRNVAFNYYRLDPDSLSGRTEVTTSS